MTNPHGQGSPQLHTTHYLIVLTAMWAALSFHWTVLTNNIVPTRVLSFATEANKGSALGLVTVLGALVSMLTGPIAGVLSDESRWRWGRRRPFLAAGVALNCVALVALIGARSFTAFVLAFLVVQFASNFAGAPYTAMLPDQVPDIQKGRATGFAGFADVLGRLAGSIFGGFAVSLPVLAVGVGAFVPILPQRVRVDPMLPLVLVTVAILAGTMLFTVLSVHEEVPSLRPQETGQGLLRRAFIFDVRAEASFSWLLASRAVNMLGINTLTTFLLYYVHDYLGVTDIDEANVKLGYLFAASALTTLPSALAVGYLIDRGQRRKRWVVGSAIGLAVISIAFVVTPEFKSALVVGALFGLCYGAYFTADWALALALLPRGDQAAKYMGIWGIAGTLPQVVAPGIGGVLLDTFNGIRHNLGYPVVFVTVVIYLVIGTSLLSKVQEPAPVRPSSGL